MKKLFTLMELLIVVAIIGILVTLLIPSLRKARSAAKNAVCLSNTSQWSKLLSANTIDNGGQYLTDLGSNENGTWMKVLDGDHELSLSRVCPEADTKSSNGYGNTTQYWGRKDVQFHYFAEGDYGSYGINHWINNLPDNSNGWRGSRNDHYMNQSRVEYPAKTPAFADCAWYGGNPTYLGNGQNGQIVSSANFNSSNSMTWSKDMGRFQMLRHGKGINVSMADGSARRVNVSQLWSLYWHRGFEVQNYIEIPWD